MEGYFSKLSFNLFCEVCERIIVKKDKKKKFDILRAFINYHRNKCDGDNFHSLMRLFLPKLERERGPYGIKEYNLARTYIRILHLPKEGHDAQRLIHYTAPSSVKSSDVIGDFAEVAYWILRNKCGQSTNITVGEINDNLDLIAVKHASQDPRAVDDILTELLRKMSADEQKWFLRVILKDMHLGLSNKQILYIFHPDSTEVFDLSNSLLKVCTMLNDPSVRLHEIEISLFEPFRPMLSERTDARKFNFTDTLIIETKYDGERFQLHFSNNKFKYFSRNGYEYTQTFGEDEFSGYFSRLIRNQFSPSLTSVILDGEMMGWNTKRSHIVTKAANIDVKTLKVGNIVQPCFFPFDVLYFNGEVLTNKPLIERKEVLNKSFVDLEGSIMKADYSTVSSNEDIIDAINAAIDRSEEGIILKKMDSVYKPNSRSSGWYKIKPEYTEGGLVDLDLLILGGYYGQGKQKGKVSHFMMGLAAPTENGLHPSQFESLCRVGSGYTVPELEELSNKLESEWQKLRPGAIPSTHLLSKEKPDVWISPEKSCILQIKATEVVDSSVYHCGSTLKFVRVERIRYDKPWYDCLTTSEFQNIKQAYKGKLTSGHIQSLPGKIHSQRKKETIESLVGNNKLVGPVESVSNVLESKEFYVVSGFSNTSKEDIEKLIIKNGGVIKNIPGSTTFCLIAGDINRRVKNFCESGKHTVAHFTWLQDCLEKKKLVPWTPQSLAGTTLMGKSNLSHCYDKYGDSYIEPVNENAWKSFLIG
uniref:DNA ligase 4 n=2 Tax=Lygus hesperus TaxID=30085 RepID=A0A0A9ZG36_LYGHE